MTTAPARGEVTPAETGRSCPYCRSPLDEGVAVARCAVCASTHHAECWDENRGCAVVACEAGPVPRPQAGDAKSAKPPPPDGSTDGRRAKVLAMALLALVAVVVAVAILAGGPGGSDSTSGSESAATKLPAEPEPIELEPAETPAPIPELGLSSEETVTGIGRLLDRSMRGRAATLAGDYETANAIRSEILRRLDVMDTTHLNRERSLLRRAMQASIDANEVRVECGACAAPYDATATSAKESLVAAFNPLADRHLGKTYDADEI